MTTDAASLRKLLDKQEKDVEQLNTLLRKCKSGLAEVSHDFDNICQRTGFHRTKNQEGRLHGQDSFPSDAHEKLNDGSRSPTRAKQHSAQSIHTSPLAIVDAELPYRRRDEIMTSNMSIIYGSSRDSLVLRSPKSTGYSTRRLCDLASPKTYTPTHVHEAIGLRPRGSSVWGNGGRRVPLNRSSSFEVPGPGHYDSQQKAFGRPRPTTVSSGNSESSGHSGRINKGRKPANELELTLRSKADVPGPSYYDVRGAAPGSLSGGTISTAEPRSEIEWAMFRSNERPAPWAYEPALASLSGGRFNMANAPGELDQAIARGPSTPGPGAYAVRGKTQRSLGPTGVSSGGSFPRGKKLPGEIEMEARRAALLPGPADYLPAYGPPPGGTMDTGDSSWTDLDWMIYRAQQGPGPASYRIKGIGDADASKSPSSWAQARRTVPRDKKVAISP
mmetsp:Transcript_5264/g.11088  ORF Transcript_5264/g.11088 Transcript_5264/m.11088 type:complete len:445 (-) Transcript_5264:65-1399(-)